MDFSKNKAEGDDIIGDAYEYLMRKFATDSGKSKGQFYTPAEVSRILTKIIGIDKCSDHNATVCDPACGSGSLLIRAVAEAPFEISGYGQEKETSTAGLAKMNAVLHNKATISIMSGNTFSDPQFLNAEDNSELERFDYVVANPPFSLKNWKDGLKEFDRFSGYGDVPPEKNGDYAWLMHILKILKSTGKAAVILPHGVLFRGNAEGTIRQTIVKKGLIKGIIGLPPNLFYGTGIPACILVIDKEGAENRAGIFMIDAGNDFVKDGNKNRLRERDIYKIVTTFNNAITTDPKYARFVPNLEIEKNDYNLNITRYIDSSQNQDVQDIYAHMHGGIPEFDIAALNEYWDAFPSLKSDLLSTFSKGYLKLNVSEDLIGKTIALNSEYSDYGEKFQLAFNNWKNFADTKLRNIDSHTSCKHLILELSEYLLNVYKEFNFVDRYDVYQVLLSYWGNVLNDDVLLIASDDNGYMIARETIDITKESKKEGQEAKIIGWEGRLIPKELMISEMFTSEKKVIDELSMSVEDLNSQLVTLIENAPENSELAGIAEDENVKKNDIQEKIQEKLDEIKSKIHTPMIDSLLEFRDAFAKGKYKKKEYSEIIAKNNYLFCVYNEKGKVTKASINAALNNAYADTEVPDADADDYTLLLQAQDMVLRIAEITDVIKEKSEELDQKARARYIELTDAEILDLLVEKKWYGSINKGIQTIYSAIANSLADRLRTLNSRYEFTLPDLEEQTDITRKCLSEMLAELEGKELDSLGLSELKVLFGEGE